MKSSSSSSSTNQKACSSETVCLTVFVTTAKRSGSFLSVLPKAAAARFCASPGGRFLSRFSVRFSFSASRLAARFLRFSSRTAARASRAATTVSEAVSLEAASSALRCLANSALVASDDDGCGGLTGGSGSAAGGGS